MMQRMEDWGSFNVDRKDGRCGQTGGWVERARRASLGQVLGRATRAGGRVENVPRADAEPIRGEKERLSGRKVGLADEAYDEWSRTIPIGQCAVEYAMQLCLEESRWPEVRSACSSLVPCRAHVHPVKQGD